MVKLEEPDKGQAWVVAIAACIINMILSGLSRMIGMLYVAVLETYGVTRQQATLPFTVRNAIRMLSGPLVGVVGQRFGIRTVTFWGGVVASLGATLCYTAPTIAWLAVFWGGMHGFGFAFANTLFQVVVNQYFQKYRATASGIALSGACVGSFVFPVMIEEILDTFGLSGGFLILGGIVMHVLPPSLLLKSPPWITDPEKYARLKALQTKQESVETLESNMAEAPPEDTEHLREWRSVVRTTSLNNCPVEEVEICNATLSTENLTMFTYKNTGTMREKHRNIICTLYKITESPSLDRRNSEMIGSSVSIKETCTCTSPIPTISGDVEAKNFEVIPAAASEKTPTKAENQTSIRESLHGIGVLYTNPVYILINVCMTTYIVIFIPILTVIVDYGIDKGIPESNGKYLINAMAAGDLIGRLGFGWVTDRGIITIPNFIFLAFLLQGAFIALFPFASTLYTYMLLLVLYGAAAGTILVHFPLLVFRYVDSKFQSVAMGCVGFMSGIVSFGIPPMIGHFRDEVGSYDGMFYLTGAISVFSGGFWLLTPLMIRIHNRNQEKKLLTLEEKYCEQCKNIETLASSNGQKPS